MLEWILFNILIMQNKSKKCNITTKRKKINEILGDNWIKTDEYNKRIPIFNWNGFGCRMKMFLSIVPINGMIHKSIDNNYIYYIDKENKIMYMYYLTKLAAMKL